MHVGSWRQRAEQLEMCKALPTLYNTADLLTSGCVASERVSAHQQCLADWVLPPSCVLSWNILLSVYNGQRAQFPEDLLMSGNSLAGISFPSFVIASPCFQAAFKVSKKSRISLTRRFIQIKSWELWAVDQQFWNGTVWSIARTQVEKWEVGVQASGDVISDSGMISGTGTPGLRWAEHFYLSLGWFHEFFWEGLLFFCRAEL